MDGKVYDFSDLFREVADALRLHGYFNEALQFYNPLQLIEDQTDDSYFTFLASCYEALLMFDEAEECIKYIIKYDEDNLSAWTQAATMFDNANMPERAAPYIDKVISLRRYKALQRKREREASPSSSLPVMNAGQRNYLSSRVGRSSTGKVYGKSLKRQLQVTLTKERVQTIYLEMTSLKQNDRLEQANLRARWMEGARSLLAEFRLKKSFFPIDRTAPLEATARNLRKDKDLASQNDENTGRLQNLLGRI
jgi:general transcription factor 3C polypeptide 3 (transcription factor C subunit 4)